MRPVTDIRKIKAAEALVREGMPISHAAKLAGISRSTYYRHAETRPVPA